MTCPPTIQAKQGGAWSGNGDGGGGVRGGGGKKIETDYEVLGGGNPSRKRLLARLRPMERGGASTERSSNTGEERTKRRELTDVAVCQSAVARSFGSFARTMKSYRLTRDRPAL